MPPMLEVRDCRICLIFLNAEVRRGSQLTAKGYFSLNSSDKNRQTGPLVRRCAPRAPQPSPARLLPARP